MRESIKDAIYEISFACGDPDLSGAIALAEQLAEAAWVEGTISESEFKAYFAQIAEASL